MDDKGIYGATQNGTYLTTVPNPHVDLAVTAVSGVSIATTFASVMSDGETATITITVDEDNWAIYSGAAFVDAATDSFDLSAATLLESTGTISTTDAVTVYGLEPHSDRVSAPATSSSSGEVDKWAWDGLYYYRCVIANTWVRFIPESVWT